MVTNRYIIRQYVIWKLVQLTVSCTVIVGAVVAFGLPVFDLGLLVMIMSLD